MTLRCSRRPSRRTCLRQLDVQREARDDRRDEGAGHRSSGAMRARGGTGDGVARGGVDGGGVRCRNLHDTQGPARLVHTEILKATEQNNLPGESSGPTLPAIRRSVASHVNGAATPAGKRASRSCGHPEESAAPLMAFAITSRPPRWCHAWQIGRSSQRRGSSWSRLFCCRHGPTGVFRPHARRRPRLLGLATLAPFATPAPAHPSGQGLLDPAAACPATPGRAKLLGMPLTSASLAVFAHYIDSTQVLAALGSPPCCRRQIRCSRRHWWQQACRADCTIV